jgi:1-acyl-sn-glycerol-3-phosphate acyltransferase
VIAQTVQSTSRIARAALTSLSALGEARLVGHYSPSNQSHSLAAAVRELCRIHSIEVDVQGVFPERPCVLVANHLSYLDPLVILSQRPAAPIAKAEVEDWPIIGPAARALGVNFVDRGSMMKRARTLRRAVLALRAGVNVLNFPEGTTTNGSRLLPFQRGIFGAAMIAEVPVIPLVLSYENRRLAWTDNATFLPHYWRLSNLPHARARLIVRPPMWARPTEEPADFAARVRATIALSLDGHLRA